jgi:hypothetical protein
MTWDREKEKLEKKKNLSRQMKIEMVMENDNPI